MTIINEAKIYNYLNNNKYIPTFKGFFSDSNNNYLIIELMNNSLKYYKNKLTISQLNDISHQIINAISFIHSKGIVHRDIKPDNFLINANNKIKVCDFGFAKQIIVNKKHISIKNIDKIIGTPNFISVNVHNLIEPTRRDDMESIVYTILYIKESLPWSLDEADKIIVIKKNLLNNNLIPDNIKNLLKIIRNLEFSEDINYKELSNLITFA